jgi:hypothetical protein
LRPKFGTLVGRPIDQYPTTSYGRLTGAVDQEPVGSLIYKEICFHAIYYLN